MVGLVSSALANMDPLPACGDVLDWYEDIAGLAGRIHKAVNPARPRIAFGACPDCGEWYGVIRKNSTVSAQAAVRR